MKVDAEAVFTDTKPHYNLLDGFLPHQDVAMRFVETGKCSRLTARSGRCSLSIWETFCTHWPKHGR